MKEDTRELLAKAERLDSAFHRWLLDAFDARLQTDYGFTVRFGTEEAQAQVEPARLFLEAARDFLEAEVSKG